MKLVLFTNELNDNFSALDFFLVRINSKFYIPSFHIHIFYFVLITK